MGFLLEKVKFLMSSSRLLQEIIEIVDVFVDFLQQQQPLEIVANVALVAENHGNIRTFRTDTVARTVSVSFVF